jgi:hypothetical protein
MGLLNRSKSSKNFDTESLAKLDSLWDKDPAAVVFYFISNSSDPVYVFARTVMMLVVNKVISPSQFQALGLTENELVSIHQALQSEDPGLLLRYEAEVAEARAEYEKTIGEILQKSGLSLNPDGVQEFSTSLARFAYNNNLTDLNIAYRLMCAEVGDPLARYKAPKPDTGYL